VCPKRQRKFTDLSGAAESQGDLTSVVLHSMKVTHVRSSFPIPLGARITGVDDCTFSSNGEAFSTILLPETESQREKLVQSDDTTLTYEFARKVNSKAYLFRPFPFANASSCILTFSLNLFSVCAQFPG
jgi:hypothetical protein